MSTKHKYRGLVGRRTKVALLTGGSVLALGSGVGMAMAGQSASDTTQKPPAQSTDLEQPGRIDAKRASQAAVDYLVDSGMKRSAAQTQVKNQQQYAKTASKLRAELPDDIQSLYVNDAGKLVANVVTEQGAAKARGAGVTPRQVSSSWDELKTIQKDLLASVEGKVSGLVVEIDPKTSSVKVMYPADSTAKEVAPLLAKTKQYGDAVTVAKTQGTLGTAVDVNAGSAFNTVDKGRCTVGWAVRIDLGVAGPTDGFMTAGHCLDNNTGIEFNGKFAGTGFDITFGGNGDFGMVILGTQDDPNFFSKPHLAFTDDPVTLVNRNPVVGTVVCKLGITTDYTCGKIDGLNASVDVEDEGTVTRVNGMIDTTMCVEGGDSGAPAFEPQGDQDAPDAVTAMGIVSSAILNPNGTCFEKTDGPGTSISFVQPIDPIVPPSGPYAVKIAGG